MKQKDNQKATDGKDGRSETKNALTVNLIAGLMTPAEELLRAIAEIPVRSTAVFQEGL